MKKDIAKLSKLINRKLKLVHECKAVGDELDLLVDKIWGFSYSETNDDQIIDALDYGTAGLNVDGFIELMDGYKLKRDNEINTTYIKTK